MKAVFFGVLIGLFGTLAEAADQRALAREIYAELIGIDTTQSTGNTTLAAQAMAKRLLAAGFAPADVEVIGPTPNRGNLLAHLKGTGAKRPLLLMAHLDVVDAAASEWTVPALELTESDGYFYGRGTADDKAMAANFVTNMLAYAREGWVPDRDIYLALTADEEGGTHNGMQWLLANRPALHNAEFALNEGGGGTLVDGRAVSNAIQFSEKLYQSYRVEASGPGGHSSLPTADNPIYRVAAGIARIAAFEFPINLSDGTRAYFRAESKLRSGVQAADMDAITDEPLDPVAARRLSAQPRFNGMLRTTCVATQISGGHGENALPMRATSIINCRILPHETVESVTAALAKVLADDQLTITPLAVAQSGPPSALSDTVMEPVRAITASMWPGAAVVPVMSLGYTDGVYTRSAGILTYGISGAFIEEGDVRAHGRDERLAVKSFHESREFLDRLVRALAD